MADDAARPGSAILLTDKVTGRVLLMVEEQCLGISDLEYKIYKFAIAHDDDFLPLCPVIPLRQP
jgi:hypothetical protein